MRLGDYLSKDISNQYIQVEKFAGEGRLTLGTPKKIDIGQIADNFFCSHCDDNRTFLSSKFIQMIPITMSLISMDARLSCSVCGESVAAWFLIDIDGDIMSQVPKVRLLKRNIRYTDVVNPPKDKYWKYSEALTKADIAFREGLGAGAIIYLRKIFEVVAQEVADENGINICDRNGHRINFRDTLNRICAHVDFIPQEFWNDGYKLFRELSKDVHGEFNDDQCLAKYPALLRLIRGILDKQIDREEMNIAQNTLGWVSDADDNNKSSQQ